MTQSVEQASRGLLRLLTDENIFHEKSPFYGNKTSLKNEAKGSIQHFLAAVHMEQTCISYDLCNFTGSTNTSPIINTNTVTRRPHGKKTWANEF